MRISWVNSEPTSAIITSQRRNHAGELNQKPPGCGNVLERITLQAEGLVDRTRGKPLLNDGFRLAIAF
jgi:hypothetical protein